MKVKTGSGYMLKSKKTGKPLSKGNLTLAQVKKREQQVNYFKSRGGR